MYSMDILDQGSHTGRMEWDSVKFLHTTQSSVQFKTYKIFTSITTIISIHFLFIFNIYYLIFSYHN
jgi:hypothetical protein